MDSIMTDKVLEKKLRYDRRCEVCRIHTVQVKKFIKALNKECFICKNCGSVQPS